MPDGVVVWCKYINESTHHHPSLNGRRDEAVCILFPSSVFAPSPVAQLFWTQIFHTLVAPLFYDGYGEFIAYDIRTRLVLTFHLFGTLA